MTAKLNRIHRALTALAVGSVATVSLTSCGHRAPSSSDATSQIQAIYDRQDAGFSAENTDDMFYHVKGTARETDIDGNTLTAAKQQTQYGGLFFHGKNLRAKTLITNITIKGNTATVFTAGHQSYLLTNTTSNTQQGISEPFESDTTAKDVWTFGDDGWWQDSSQVLTDKELRNGMQIAR